MGNASQVQVRDARPDEADAIRTLTLTAFAEYADRMPVVFWAHYRRSLERTLNTWGPEQHIVADKDGLGLVGSVWLFPVSAAAYETATQVGASPEVRLLAVDPRARGQGVGSALMAECARRALGAGARMLCLHTMDIMDVAVRLYERLGYVRAPELDFSPVPGMVVKGYRLHLGMQATSA
jgi:GNAT superfamily N-acetyltransferase